MNSDELHKELAKYVGLRVRISSDATASGALWRESYPELIEVVTRESDGAVCCKTSDGVWSIVIPEGLKIEVEEEIGTGDFATGPQQMELIHMALEAYRDAKPSPPAPNERARKKLDWSDW